MKKLAVFGLHILIVIVVAGCSEKKHNVTTTSNDEWPNRVTQIDMAFALWYSYQHGAALEIERILDIKFGNIYIGRDPEDILYEQHKHMAEIKTRSFPKNEVLDDALKRWHENQIEAVNCLREVLAKSRVIADENQNAELILDLQHSDVATLKRELVKLGYEHWKQEK